MTDFLGLDRYIVTERLVGDSPSADDPLAQAFKRHSGMYDIRDSQSGNVICGSTSDLKAARKCQARWNSLLIPSL